jgi:hypothetical protein
MIELQFANKTAKDVALARKINKLVAVIKELQKDSADPILERAEFADLAKYKVFDNIIPITNDTPEPVSSSSDFSHASIRRRIAAGYSAAAKALEHPPLTLSALKAAI